MIDLLVLAELNPDLVVRGDDVEPVFGQVEKLVGGADLVIGSSGAILACGAARLGLTVAVIGICGDDAFGRFMLDALVQRGVDVSGCVVSPAVPTGVSVILSHGDDRAILTALGAIDQLSSRDIDRALVRSARHVHVSSYYLQRQLQPDVPELLRAARAAGATTSLDTNWDPDDRWGDDLDAALAETDVFLPNAEEAYRIARVPDAPDALERLAARVPTVAIKLGAAGAIARVGEQTTVARPPIVDVADTTGAGDSFGAGFLCGLLRGDPLPAALRLAVACGSLSCRAAGGTAAQPTLAEAEAVGDVAF